MCLFLRFSAAYIEGTIKLWAWSVPWVLVIHKLIGCLIAVERKCNSTSSPMCPMALLLLIILLLLMSIWNLPISLSQVVFFKPCRKFRGRCILHTRKLSHLELGNSQSCGLRCWNKNYKEASNPIVMKCHTLKSKLIIELKCMCESFQWVWWNITLIKRCLCYKAMLIHI